MPRPARLTLLPHPFDARGRLDLELEPGRALVDVLELEAPRRAAWAVAVNGRPVRAELLDDVVLREGDLVTARPVPGEPASIGLVIAAIAKATAAYLGASATTAAVIGAVAGAAATYAAARMLAPDVSKSANVPSSQPYFAIGGVRNTSRPYGVIPQHYGTLRVVPDLIAPPITSISTSGVQTVRALFCVGLGRYSGVVATGDAIRHGAQPISSLGPSSFASYSGLESGDTPSDRLGEFTTNVFEEPLGLVLRHLAVEGSQEHIRTTTEDALAFDVQLVFPQGIWRVSPDGNPYAVYVDVLIQYREVGAVPWTLGEKRRVGGYILEKFAENFHFDPSLSGQWEVSVKLLAVDGRGVYPSDRGGGGGSVAMTGDAIWASLRSYLLGEGIDDELTDDVTMFGVAIEASELVNGTLDQINVECTRVLATWTPADGWSDVDLGDRNPAAYTATGNPAWCLANELRKAGIPDDEIDAPQIKAWADFCTAKGWTINWQQNDEMTLDETQRSIASAGQAFPSPRGSLFSVVYDVDREPVAAFGPHNARDLTATQTVIERVDAIRVRFVNTRDTEGRLDERVLYFGGHSSSTASVYRTADVLNGLTDPVLVERYIRLERLKAERRSISYTWVADWSAAVVEVGDVVLLQGAGALMGEAQSICTGYSTRDAGAHVDEVFVDPAVRIESGREYHVRLRTRARGASGGYRILALPIDNPLTAGVQMLSALPIDGDFDVPVYDDDAEVEQIDDLVDQPAFVGEPDDGLVLVLEIRFGEPGSCELMGVDFAPSIFTETLLETPHESGISPRDLANLAPDAPVLSGSVTSRITGHAGTGYGYHAIYEFRLPLAPAPAFPPISYYRLQRRYHTYPLGGVDDGGRGVWTDLPDQPAPTQAIVISLGFYKSFDMRVWAVSVAGAPSEPLVVPNADIVRLPS